MFLRLPSIVLAAIFTFILAAHPLQAAPPLHIPLEIREQYRIVPLHAASTKRFQRIMEDLVKTYFPEHRAAATGYRYLLSDEEEPNAFFIQKLRPPTFVFSRGLIQKLQNLNQFLFVVGHELRHFELEVELGPGANSKGEEAWADRNGVQTLWDAGLSPTEALAANDILDAQKNVPIYAMHPSSGVRPVLFQDFLAEFHHDRGKPGSLVLAMPEELREVASGAKYISNLQKYLPGGLSDAEKIKRATTLILAERTWNYTRINALRTEIEALIAKADFTQSDQWSHWSKLIDAIIEFAGRSQNDKNKDRFALRLYEPIKKLADVWIYQNSIKKTHGRSSHEPVFPPGPGARLGKNLIKWIYEEKDYGESLILSEQCLHDISTLVKAGLPLVFPQLPYYASRSEIPTQMPWEHLTEFVKKDDSKAILKLMLVAGVHDRRVFNYLPIMPETLARFLADPVFSVSNNGQEISGLSLGEGNKHRNPNANKEEGFLSVAFPILDRLYDQAIAGDLGARHELDALVASKAWKRHLCLCVWPKVPFLGLKHFAADPGFFLKINTLLFKKGGDQLSDRRAGERALIDAFLASGQAANPDPARKVIRKIFRDGFLDRPKDEPYGGSRALDLDQSPLAIFAIEDPMNIFNLDERRDFIQRYVPGVIERYYSFAPQWSSIRNRNEDSRGNEPLVTDYTAKKFWQIFGFSDPRDFTEAISLMNEMTVSPYGFLRDLAWHHFSKFFVPSEMVTAEGVTRFVSRVTLPADYPVHELIREPWIKKFSSLDTPFRAWISRADVKRAWESDPLNVQLAKWLLFSKLGFLKQEQIWQDELLTKILDQIDFLGADRTLSPLGQILMRDTRIISVKLRTRAMEAFSLNVKRRFGTDDGSLAYTQRIKPYLDLMTKEMTELDRVELLQILAERIEVQGRLGEIFRSKVTNLNRSRLALSYLVGVLGEAAIEALKRSPEFGAKLTEFLSGSVNSESLNKIIASARKHAVVKVKFDQYEPPSERNLLSGVEDARLEREFENIHENYWNVSLQVRAMILRSLLFPVKGDGEKQYREAFTTVVRLVLPLDTPNRQERIEAMGHYLDVLPSYQRNLYLTAILASSDPRNATSPASSDAFLAQLLASQGPMEKKLAQGIHSHPSTPPEIREAMRLSKTKVDVPPRWNQLSLIEGLPQEITDQIERVNQVEGSASFWIVYNVTLKTGAALAVAGQSTQAALAILRPHAAGQSEDGFEKGIEALKRFSEGSAKRIGLYALEHARETAKYEIDPSQTQNQYRLATQNYSANFGIEGHDFEVRPVQLLASGENYRVMTLAEGLSFNELPDTNAEERQIKRRWAMVMVTVELAAILSGRPFDEDPHGGQNRILGNRLNRFDFGNLTPHLPSAEDRQLLAQVLINLLRQKVVDRKFDLEAPFEQTPGAATNAYLHRVRRALLALQDFMGYLNESDLHTVFLGLLRHGLIHSDVITEFAQSDLEMSVSLDLEEPLRCEFFLGYE